MFDFSSFIRMVRIRTFFGRFGLKTLGPTVAFSSFAIAQVAQDFVIIYMTFCWDIDPPCIFCGYDQLLSMDPPCSFVAMTPLDLIWRLFAYWATIIVSSVIHMLDPPIFMGIFCIRTCMYQRSVFLTFISLTGTFVRAFRSWILCSLHTQLFPL